MKRVLTSEQMRQVDRRASEEAGLPVAVLMERAGAALARAASKPSPLAAVVLCGRGNNGGDGLVAARLLHQQGIAVSAVVVGGAEGLGGETARAARAALRAGLTLADVLSSALPGAGAVVIDALLGTGLSRPPEGPFAEAIAWIAKARRAGARVVAADVPSGVSSDSGEALGSAVTADLTLALGSLKPVHCSASGLLRCGAVELDDLGLPDGLLAAVEGVPTFVIEEADARGRLPVRGLASHKGSFGHLLLVAGSFGKTGAAALAGVGALRAGAGLVTVTCRKDALLPILAHAPELMGLELASDGALGLGDLNRLLEAADGKSALVLGPGIARGEETAKLIEALLEELTIPVVLDADGLNAIAGRLDVLEKAKAPLVLTPHPGEMARLLETTAAAVNQDRLGSARALAKARHVVVVLKGAQTVIALEDGAAFISPTGNPGLATAGTGDVLSGVVGALLAQGLTEQDAAIAGVYAHGLAGDVAASRTGKAGLLASDLFGGLCEVWVRWNL